jgi:hypothetical protein
MSTRSLQGVRGAARVKHSKGTAPDTSPASHVVKQKTQNNSSV